jgi:hypothetical protein
MSKQKKKRKIWRYSGQKMAAKAEVNYAKMLDRFKIPWMYESEVLPWVPPKKKYTPDFMLPKKDGSKLFIEFKGYLRPRDKTKMRMIKKQYPDMDIRIVFMNSKRAQYSGAKTNYGDWANNNKYQWHNLNWTGKYEARLENATIEDILPESWLKEIKL